MDLFHGGVVDDLDFGIVKNALLHDFRCTEAVTTMDDID
jgi:hypothetical protein